jgi:glycosyltransferase involved in cell wall biosynthesis
MRVLVIVDTYVPSRISGALQMRDLVQEMRNQGHAPTVVVPAPGLKSAWCVEVVDGVEVLRVRTTQTKDVARIRRVFAEWWLPFALLRGLRRSPLAATRWEGVVWYSPTIFLGPMVRALKRQWGCRGYLILRDLFPDWAVDTGVLRKGLAYRFFKRVERQQYAVADVIGVQTPANIPLVRADSPADACIEVLNNWLAPPPADGVRMDLSAGALAGRTIFAYTGNMGVAQDMDCLIELAARLKQRRDLGFLFVGRGSELSRIRKIVSDRALDNVQFIDEVDSAQIPGLLAQCHVGLIALDTRHTTHNIPGKLLTYLHAGLPVLARINRGNDLEGLVRHEQVGFVVAGDDPDRLQADAQRLGDAPDERIAMAARAQSLVHRMFSPQSAVAQVVRGLSAANEMPCANATADATRHASLTAD